MSQEHIVLNLSEETKAFLTQLLTNQQQVLLEEMNNKLDKLIRVTKELKNMNAETVRLLGEIDEASTELAADIQVLIDKANETGSVTAAEINAALAPKVEFLKQLAADTNAPVPPVPEPTA